MVLKKVDGSKKRLQYAFMEMNIIRTYVITCCKKRKEKKDFKRLNKIFFILRMAPEVIMCETMKDEPYDYKSDVWSLGKLISSIKL